MINVYTQIVKILFTLNQNLQQRGHLTILYIQRPDLPHNCGNSVSNLVQKSKLTAVGLCFFFHCLALEVRPALCLKKTAAISLCIQNSALE